jgi:hypothetical protein
VLLELLGRVIVGVIPLRFRLDYVIQKFALAVLGTHPDWQSRIASEVLAPVLGHCDADGLPAYLEMQRKSNVQFYRGHGFEVIGTKQLSNGAPNMWLMWREVRPGAPPIDGR